MNEADLKIGDEHFPGKRKFKNGDNCPWDKRMVLWGYRSGGEWWVTWEVYWQMAKKHKGLVRQRKGTKRNGKRGLLSERTGKKKIEHPHKQQKKLLLEFWDYFKSNPRYSIDRINMLKKYADFVIHYKKSVLLSERRKEFNKRKFALVDGNDSNKWICFVCHEKAECRHHIIQLQNGGLNSRKNLVPLCHCCHKKIHPWMD
jgi:hypothetical protein